ncbi:hypothetical protein MCOR25_008575 [Pyricularia grisea]|nr:hypothetical protein MCOR25_008575 [Pyricularia grisea]
MPMTPSMLSPHLNKYFSLPTTFTIISCYMWLFRGYEAVFAAIHNALVVQNNQARGGMQENRTDQLNSKGKKPDLVIFPDIKIGGIDLDCHPHVQIEMLIHVSCQMLQRIEAALGIDPTTSRDGTTTLQNLPAGAGRDGMLNVTAAPALLQTFLHGGGFDSCSVGDKVPKSARMSLDSGILQSILENLRGCREFAANQI